MSVHPREDPRANRDEGSALVLVMVMIVICALIVVPVLTYATAVTRSSRVLQDKAERVEAVKGGLRTVLADPIALYKACDAAGLTVSVNLAGPGLHTAVSTKCYKMADVNAADPTSLRYAVASTQVGSSVPTGITGSTYPTSGAAPETQWLSHTAAVPTINTIWAPNLPAHGLNQRSAAGYTMPAGFTPCTVYFPGTYRDPVTLTSATPVFFTSGIYYFEKAVRISGNANVVVGDGSALGCSNDQEAAFYAVNAPATHDISGLGATFVFGAAGQLVVDDTTAGTSSLVFNQRYVAPADESALPSAGISIESVNGTSTGVATAVDYNLPGVLSVPQSQVGSDVLVPAAGQEYLASTLVPAAGPTVPLPIITIDFTTAATSTVSIPGYVAVPQGLIRVNVSTAAAAANKNVQISGGVLAGSFAVSAVRPSTFVFGMLNPIVQKLFRIITVTSSGKPVVTSSAIVQVNENGAYAVNSWAVQ